MDQLFKLHSPFPLAGDQPKAIEELSQGLRDGLKDQVLLGATGTGKTYTVAHVIQQVQRPTLLNAHNKTLALQLCQKVLSTEPPSSSTSGSPPLKLWQAP